MIRTIIAGAFLSVLMALLESSVLRYAAIFHVVPDLALCVVVYVAYQNGSLAGEITGFVSGLLLDFLSAAPLGLHTFTFTCIGAAVGVFRGKFVLGRVFFPVLFATGAVLAKAVLLLALRLLFGDTIPVYHFFARELWVEVAYTALCAPFLFVPLRAVNKMLHPRDKGF